MKLYFAPLEGITGYVFRNAFTKAFKPNIDKFFSPFIAPGVNQILTPKELRDIHPDNNKGITLVPQILANNANDFLIAKDCIKELGYNEINLNLGCPSGTVVAKNKGSGLLGDLDMLERMLDKIYETSDVKISIKTRIGKNDSEDFPELMDMFNKFPVAELIIHPRIRTDFYKNSPDMEKFDYAVKMTRNDICYNGDIVSLKKYENIIHKYPKLKAVMIGRGFLYNPALANQIEGKKIDASAVENFHNYLLEDYIETMSGDKPVLFKMKELWFYMHELYEDNEKLYKKIKKAQRLDEYKIYARELLKNPVRIEI